MLHDVYAEFDEGMLARQVAKKRLRVTGDLQTQTGQQRLARYLAGQGFDPEIIRTILTAFAPSEELQDLPPEDAGC